MISQTSTSPLSTPPASEPTFKPDLVRRLLLGIFGGTWKAGDRLREENLASLFKVSRTPVREALQEVAAVGLVELRPNCGALVAPFGPREIEEIYEVRALLEAEATQLACEHIDPAELRQLQKTMTELLDESSRSLHWSQCVWEADCHLHNLIAARCPNRRLAREIARYGTFIQAVRETVGNRDRAQDVAIREHRAVVAALLRRDAVKAGAAMRLHVHNAGVTAVEAIRPIFTPGRGGARSAS